MITHVVFDFDGTLADSKEAAVRLYNEVAGKSGYGLLTADNLETMRNLSVLERCRQLGVPPYKLPWLMVQITRRFRQAMQSIEFNEGIPELLQELRGRGLRLMILSSNDEGNIRAFLKRHSAEEWVEDVYCSSSIFGKARLLRALMKRAGLNPDQLVYVGDEHRDVEACKEVGVKVIAVRWGVDADARLRQAGPNHIADRPAEIVECVSRWSTAP
ncbi:HAD-IA family hydrolase [Vitiosangium sp. GDMCC 1.1324]|uniref:HAD-IA family hydrolase n=1 Tax=Vitiosangium sp. (strain GDMCC 1.1324) TaxID=2138576 RepID=UPI000D3BAAD7|nr:HAD-IA family hydrolase [Vitiosangium sp. GDMCC 1.1324]PTL76148.1 haloacid dehalogenase [Vitiosangium sp. GDMCC 1.1324]